MMTVLRGEAGVTRAAELLRQGECVALPTETVYGLAADAANDDAVAKIFAAKGRPRNHPLIVHIPSAEHLDYWATDVPTGARLLARQCWPGPLTLLLNKSDRVSSLVTSGLPTIGLRVPAHPLFLQVLARVNTGLAAPSANRYKQLSPTSAEQVASGLGGRIAAVLDGGPCEFGLESTIVDFTVATPRIVRAGPLSRQQLEQLLGSPVEMPLEHDVVVAGNVKAHYQPRTPLRRLDPAELAGSPADFGNAGFIIHSDRLRSELEQLGFAATAIRQLPGDAAGYGRQLYGSLYALDQQALSTLFIEMPPHDDTWLAVNDRLKRALEQ